MIFEGDTHFHAYRPAAWLKITGGDALTFLQGQLTNDVRPIAQGGAVYGLLLDHKGKVQADCFVVGRSPEAGFWLGSYASPGEAMRRRLEAFIIADDVEAADCTGEWAGVTVWTDAGKEAVGALTPDGVVFPGRRGGGAHWECVFPAEKLGEVKAKLTGAREDGATEVERRRIGAGIPAIPGDIGPGELPGEGGLEAAAISYTKGCYAGQEVMARLKSMGQVRRRLLRVKGSGAIPPLPAALYQSGHRIGELRSAVSADGESFLGLALLTLMNLEAGRPLGWNETGSPVVFVEEKP